MTQPDKNRPAQRAIESVLFALERHRPGGFVNVHLQLTPEDAIAVMEALAVGDGFLWQMLELVSYGITPPPVIPKADAHLGAVEP